jgi:hypothetical protein
MSTDGAPKLYAGDFAITAAPKHRETYRFIGFEAEEMADLAEDINTWLANNPGWSVKSVQHSSYSVAIDEQMLYGFSALLEVSRS